MVAEQLHQPVVVCVGYRELVLRVWRVVQREGLIRIKNLGYYPVALLVRQAPVDVSAAGRIIAELAVLVVFFDAASGNVHAPRTFAIDYAVLGSVLVLDDLRRAVPVLPGNALVELRRFLDVRVRGDDLHLAHAVVTACSR